MAFKTAQTPRQAPSILLLTRALQENNTFAVFVAECMASAIGQMMSQQQLSRAEAYRRFGRRKVEQWISEGRLTFYYNDNRTRHYFYMRDLLEAQAGRP